ncbi:MAG: hypothetical protein HDS77_06405 [Bacteroidales bacterium]|nr:hypothetical protein [Bacteroidales bacterium]
MTSLRNIITWPRRRWRSRGFGIHSPFAYAFVTETLAAKGAGDCEERVRAVAGKDYRRMALLWRCVSRLQPDSIALYPEADDTARQVIEMAAGSRKPRIIRADDTATETPTFYFISGIDKGETRDLWQRISSRHTRGMDFTDLHTGILCPYPHLPRQSYRIVFR